MSEASDHRNYYDVLHVSRNAPVEIIRGSYRTLMQRLKHHPDLGGDTATAALINEAHAVLTDPERRAEYDAELAILERVAEGFVDTPNTDRPAAAQERTLDAAHQCIFCATPHRHGANIDRDATCENCGSPLCAAENLRIESSDHRAISRIRKRQKIIFYTHCRQNPGFSGRTEDISLNGLRLITRQALTEGQHVRIVSRVLDAVGRVSHCGVRRRGWSTENIAGISFLTMRILQSSGGLLSQRV